MKKILLAFSLLVITSITVKAQRYCVIDSKYILEKVPEYNNAQKQLDAASDAWQKEVDAKMQGIDQMYKSYQAERPMLSEDARKKREDEIVAKEKEAKDLQKKYFGYDGEVFKKRQSLVKPIQDKVFNAVQQYAQSRGYDMVYDKAGGITIFPPHPPPPPTPHPVNLLSGEK